MNNSHDQGDVRFLGKKPTPDELTYAQLFADGRNVLISHILIFASTPDITPNLISLGY